MDAYNFGTSQYGLRMLYDTAYQQSMCKYCYQCNQERYNTDLQCTRQVFTLNNSLVPRQQSPNFLHLTQRRMSRDPCELQERKEVQRERLKFSVDAILGETVYTNDKDKNDVTPRRNDKMGNPMYSNSITGKKQEESSTSLTAKRAVFSEYQRRQLEQEFLAHKYINKQERKQLSARLCLTESQIRIWFQNRRMKWRNWQEREIMRRKRNAGLDQI